MVLFSYTRHLIRMEGFNAYKPAPQEETGPDKALVEANVELRGIVDEMGPMSKEQRVSIFKRMFSGSESTPEDSELRPYFDRITSIEEKYGRDAVKEISELYGAGRV